MRLGHVREHVIGDEEVGVAVGLDDLVSQFLTEEAFEGGYALGPGCRSCGMPDASGVHRQKRGLEGTGFAARVSD